MTTKVNQRNVFFTCACLAAFFLCVACVLITSISAWISTSGADDSMLAGDGVGLFNLLVDIVMGFFTIWGLFWAASQFSEQSIKPRLTLVLGLIQPDEGCTLIEGTPLQLPGYKITDGKLMGGRLDVGLFLENHEPKMAQHLQVVVETDSQPPVDDVRLLRQQRFPLSRADIVNNRRLTMQFEDDLVVYKGLGVYICDLRLLWQQVGSLPTTCKLEYDARVDADASYQTLVSDLVRKLQLLTVANDEITPIEYGINVLGATKIDEGTTVQLYQLPTSSVPWIKPRKKQ